MLRCKFNEKHRFEECKFPPLANDPEGFCILHSPDPNKDHEVFNQIIQEKMDKGELNFEGVFFPLNFAIIIFSGKVFDKPTNFSNSRFAGEAVFSWSKFNSYVDFAGAEFAGEANFACANFSGWASFSGVKFLKGSNFFLARFESNASFFHAEFSDFNDFGEVKFLKKANFNMAKFIGRVILKSINKEYRKAKEKWKKSTFLFFAKFSLQEINSQAALRFQDLNLSNVRFKSSDLRKMEFYNVIWNKLGFRNAVYDEVLLNQKEIVWMSRVLKKTSYLADVISGDVLEEAVYGDEWVEDEEEVENGGYFSKPSREDYARIEELCRHLKTNYEREGNLKSAGDFHYGEMEMHRRASPWSLIPLYWYNLYWFLSGYGERPVRALLCLIVLILGFSGLVSWLGMVKEIDMGTIAGLKDTLVFILEKATLQRPNWLEPANTWARLAIIFAALIIPGQAALFLLALRNRLGRRR